MKPEQFLRTIYLGDRACKAILIDSWNERVAIQVNCISRLEPGTETWNYYTGGDIESGWIVFSDVRSTSFEPPGPIPNDLINDFSVKAVANGESTYLFEFSIDSCDEVGNRKEILIRIEAGGIHLEDPARPGIEITS